MRSRPAAKPRVRSAAPAPGESLADAVARCGRDGEFLRQLREIHGCADARAAALGAVCLGGGACCKFDRTGHRLYLSTGELALLTLEPPPDPAHIARGRCPYQVGPRCVARRRRPLGCRMYFCRKSLRPALQDTYEHLHRRVVSAHQSHSLPYAYVELTTSLSQLHFLG